MSNQTTLCHLALGQRGVITAIDMADSGAAKLAARGIVPGTCVGVLQAGDPVLIGIENDRWALNQAEASAIHVDPEPPVSRSLKSLFRRRR